MTNPLCPKCGKPIEFLMQPRAIHIGNRCFLTPLGGICVPCYIAELEAQHGGSKPAGRAPKVKRVKTADDKGPGLISRIGAWFARMKPKAKEK